jgi:putative ABC transport system permease protein
VGWLISGKLLKQFAYRIDLDLSVFVTIATGAIFIALLTVSFHAYKATRVNPAQSIKIIK